MTQHTNIRIQDDPERLKEYLETFQNLLPDHLSTNDCINIIQSMHRQLYLCKDFRTMNDEDALLDVHQVVESVISILSHIQFSLEQNPEYD